MRCERCGLFLYLSLKGTGARRRITPHPEEAAGSSRVWAESVWKEEQGFRSPRLHYHILVSSHTSVMWVLDHHFLSVDLPVLRVKYFPSSADNRTSRLGKPCTYYPDVLC